MCATSSMVMDSRRAAPPASRAIRARSKTTTAGTILDDCVFKSCQPLAPSSRLLLPPQWLTSRCRFPRRLDQNRTYLFLLNRLHVPGDCVQPHFSPVLVRFDLMEDWSPNWHLSITLGEQSGSLPFNDFLYALVRKLSATSSRD